MKTKLTLTFFSLFVLCLYGVYANYETKIVEVNLDNKLKKIATKNYLEKKIAYALQNKNIEEANIYKNLADYLHNDINPLILKKLEIENSTINTYIRNTTNFTKGFLSGDFSDGASLAGSITSDMTVVGDVRDIYREGSKMRQNKDYDKFTLGLSILGVGLTATTLLSAGATTPAKVGTSLLKSAKKSGKLTKSFSKIISKDLEKVINKRALKKVDFSNISTLRKSLKQATNQKKLAHLEKILLKLNKIKKQTSTTQTLKLLKYIEDEKDLTKVAKLSKKYKKNTLAVFKVLGKGALKTTKEVINYTTKFLGFLVGAIVTLLWLML